MNKITANAMPLIILILSLGLATGCASKTKVTDKRSTTSGALADEKQKVTDPCANTLASVPTGQTALAPFEFMANVGDSDLHSKMQSLDLFVQNDSGAKLSLSWQDLSKMSDLKKVNCAQVTDDQSINLSIALPDLLAKHEANGTLKLDASLSKTRDHEAESIATLSADFINKTPLTMDEHMYFQSVNTRTYKTTDTVSARQYKLDDTTYEVRFVINRYKAGAHYQDEYYRIVYKKLGID